MSDRRPFIRPEFDSAVNLLQANGLESPGERVHAFAYGPAQELRTLITTSMDNCSVLAGRLGIHEAPTNESLVRKQVKGVVDRGLGHLTALRLQAINDHVGGQVLGLGEQDLGDLQALLRRQIESVPNLLMISAYVMSGSSAGICLSVVSMRSTI